MDNLIAELGEKLITTVKEELERMKADTNYGYGYGSLDVKAEAEWLEGVAEKLASLQIEDEKVKSDVEAIASEIKSHAEQPKAAEEKSVEPKAEGEEPKTESEGKQPSQVEELKAAVEKMTQTFTELKDKLVERAKSQQVQSEPPQKRSAFSGTMIKLEDETEV